MDQYILDKRKLKKTAKKYGLMLLVLVPIFILMETFLYGKLNTGARIAILVAVGVVVLLVINIILNNIEMSKKQKQQELAKKDVVVIKAGTVSKGKKTYVKDLTLKVEEPKDEEVKTESVKPTHKKLTSKKPTNTKNKTTKK